MNINIFRDILTSTGRIQLKIETCNSITTINLSFNFEPCATSRSSCYSDYTCRFVSVEMGFNGVYGPHQWAVGSKFRPNRPIARV